MGPNSKLAIVGGVMINCDGLGSDMFQPKMFEIITKKHRYDIFDEVFPNY